MKILHCVEFYYPHIGGAEKHVQILSEFLKNKKNQVHIATSSDKLRKKKNINNIKIIDFDIKGNFVKGLSKDINRYQDFLIKSNYDIILFYAAQQWTLDGALPILHKINAKKIFVPCGFSKLKSFFYSNYFKELKKKLNYFDEIICFSKNYQDYHFCSKYYKKKINVISNGANISNKNKYKFRKKFINKENIFLLSVANLKFNKGQDQLLKIVSNIKHKKFSLIFICSKLKKGFFYFYLKLKIFFILITNKNCEIKLLEDLKPRIIQSAFQECDYFLHASRIECSPLVLFESLSAGKIYLGTNVGNVKEVIENIEAGFCSNNLIKITKKLDYFINKKFHKNKKIKNKIKNQFYKNYSWNKILKKYHSIYKKFDKIRI